MSFLLSVWAFLRKVPVWLYGAAGAVLGLLLVWVRGKAAGRASERQKANEAALENKAKTDAIEREVDGMTDDELDREGEPWVRR